MTIFKSKTLFEYIANMVSKPEPDLIIKRHIHPVIQRHAKHPPKHHRTLNPHQTWIQTLQAKLRVVKEEVKKQLQSHQRPGLDLRHGPKKDNPPHTKCGAEKKNKKNQNPKSKFKNQSQKFKIQSQSSKTQRSRV
ncbi:hypothetical protein RND81_09G111200 [Saponaria officinalis]|uniref:Uncharacterized protein n=1 Tax=Saponaria officinalis TaxID=3572 RepID=A0AAW1ILJ4_SAPOF